MFFLIVYLERAVVFVVMDAKGSLFCIPMIDSFRTLFVNESPENTDLLALVLR